MNRRNFSGSRANRDRRDAAFEKTVEKLNRPDPDLTALASDLGWRPGEWPQRMLIEGRPYAFLKFEKDLDNDVTSAIYVATAPGGGKLTVFND